MRSVFTKLLKILCPEQKRFPSILETSSEPLPKLISRLDREDERHLLENLKVFIERDGWGEVEKFLEHRLAEVHAELENCGLDNIQGFVHLLEQRGRAKEIRSLLDLKTRLRKRQSMERENA